MTLLKEIIGQDLKFNGSLVNGAWVLPKIPNGSWKNTSPANSEWVFPEITYSYDVIETAVESARKAFVFWKKTKIEERILVLNKFKEALKVREDILARVIALETGKPFDEAKSEASALQTKIDVTIQYGLELCKKQSLDLGALGRGEIVWRPKGVLAIIGPFNFPVHLNHGHIVPALLMGNCCILKPSEKTPYSAQIYMEAAAESLPAGILQLIQGESSTAVKLIRHVGIDGVLATCSYEIGCSIQKELAEKPRKIVALEMGGKNAAIVWDKVNLEKVADDLIKSSFLTTGQRCSALSRVYVKREMCDQLIKLVHEKAKELVISHPFDENPKPFMGPIISQKALENFIRYSKIGETEKDIENIMRPKALEGVPRQGKNPLPRGSYVTPSINYVKKWNAQSVYQTHEIFGPDVFFCPVDDLDDAILAVNSNPYGLTFSFFGGDEALFDNVADEIDAGVLYWNKPTVGASGRLPFGGWKRSGNHKPAGLFAIYCSTQVQSRVK